MTTSSTPLALTTHDWEAMGTHWHISVFGEVSDDFWREVEQDSFQFEQQFSRFIAESEVNRWSKVSGAGEAEVSDTLAELLLFAQKLKTLTHGAFDPAVGGLLEAAGYDPTYSFSAKSPEAWRKPEWSISGNTLHFSGPLVIDIGGYGKGYWIDQLSAKLAKAGYLFHLVDGGGDMFATTKPDGAGWRVAIEVPGKPDEALEVITLNSQALAVSDTQKRAWGEWHHVVDPRQAKPANNVSSAAVVASSAQVADALTTCLMVGERAIWQNLLQYYPAEYLLTSGSRLEKSTNWIGSIAL
jgi:thiamine biosynthesis lipoprotein